MKSAQLLLLKRRKKRPRIRIITLYNRCRHAERHLLYRLEGKKCKKKERPAGEKKKDDDDDERMLLVDCQCERRNLSSLLKKLTHLERENIKKNGRRESLEAQWRNLLRSNKTNERTTGRLIQLRRKVKFILYYWSTYAIAPACCLPACLHARSVCWLNKLASETTQRLFSNRREEAVN